MQVSCFIVESIIRLGNIEFLFLNGPPSFRIDQKALCIVTRTVKMTSRNEWSLFCVTLYYFEDFGNIPIHSYITNSWQETIASPCSKILLFSRQMLRHKKRYFPQYSSLIRYYCCDSDKNDREYRIYFRFKLQLW